MKPVLPLVFLFLSVLLTACPSAQAPTPATSLTGDWSGTLTHNDEQNGAIPLTVTFTQTAGDLGGTALLGPALYDISGEVSGRVEGENVTFAFSYLAVVDDVDGVVTETMGTYNFTGALNGDAVTGNVVGTIEGSDLSLPGTFTLERQ